MENFFVSGFMVAVNEKKYFNFRPLQVEGNPRYVEDVPVPSQFKTILVLPFSDNDYCRNWFTLPSHARLKVKTLEAMGYATTCILSDRWINLSTEGKKRFLVDEFKKFSE